jgi:hypothetical protein
MSGVSTQIADREKEKSNAYFTDSSSRGNIPGSNLSRLQTVTLEIFRHYHRFRHLRRMLSWIIGMIIFATASVLIYEHWF